MSYHIVVGCVITGLTQSYNGDSVTFATDKGDVTATCYGDCCSSTWIEHIDLPTRGFPAKVLSVENLDMPDLGDMPGCDCVAYYGLKITTDNGDMIIDYRNDSNGYYGGSLEWPRGQGEQRE